MVSYLLSDYSDFFYILFATILATILFLSVFFAIFDYFKKG